MDKPVPGGQVDSRGLPRFWDEQRETMPKEDRDRVILERIQHQLAYAYEELPFYRNLYEAHGFKPADVQTLDDFTRKVPIVRKKDLVADQARNPIFGSYARHDTTDLARIQGSSGTSGTPTMYGVSHADWERAGNVHAMAQWMAGIRPSDVVQVGFPFGLFFGGWGVAQGVERIGATLFPLGVTDSAKHLEFIEKVRATVFSATPSYCMHLMSVAKRLGFDLAGSSVRMLLVGGEPGGSLPGTRDVLEKGWGATLIDAGSTSEMYPFQTSMGCEARSGTHLITDEVYVEIVDKTDHHTPKEMGERGAIVYSHLWRDSQPMIRFAPGDETYMTDAPCACGRTYPRLPEGVLGRLDDMLLIRGANVYPSAIETVLRSVPELDAEFRIHVQRRGALDEIKVVSELRVGVSREDSTRVIAEAEAALKRAVGIRVPVELITSGTLEQTVFKAKRVIDERTGH